MEIRGKLDLIWGFFGLSRKGRYIGMFANREVEVGFEFLFKNLVKYIRGFLELVFLRFLGMSRFFG